MPGPHASPSAHSPSPLELDRRRYRRRQGTRSVLVSLASTLALAALVWVVVVDTPGWARVQQQFLDPGVLVDAWPRVFAGLLLNLRVLVAAAIGVLVLGLALAILRTLRGPVLFPLRALAAAYTDFFRGIPLIIVLYVVGFGIPGLQLTPRLPAEVWGTIALVLVYSAYVSEVIRAGIDAVHPSQVMSARSLGLTRGQALRVVILPQAVRKVTPALMNDFVAMQKDVGLISILGAVDAVLAAKIEVSQTYNFTPYIVAGILFILLAIPTIRLTDWYAARLRRREQTGSLL